MEWIPFLPFVYGDRKNVPINELEHKDNNTKIEYNYVNITNDKKIIKLIK